MGESAEEARSAGPAVEGYRVWLADRGYTYQTVRNMLADLARLGRWMSGEGLGWRSSTRTRWSRSWWPRKSVFLY